MSEPQETKPVCIPDNPLDCPEYLEFVEKMSAHCHCDTQYRPCDGVLAGGLCDNIHDEPGDHAGDIAEDEDRFTDDGAPINT